RESTLVETSKDKEESLNLEESKQKMIYRVSKKTRRRLQLNKS
ncbi:9215_t:CDS:1, partial [Scutellospora calospora]